MNKRKVLDAARKFAQKGSKEKALKEYARLLKAEPRDAKLLLEIGDAHRRWGQNEEAISHYSRVAEQYKAGGFDARAVAVYKQIVNLDDKRYPAFVSLAELYQRMGLDAEAVNTLQTAADGYNREGNKPAALELLRKMATLDPSNTTSRMKVAELLRQEELLDEAICEYEAVAEEMIRQGANDSLVAVYERILEIRPDQVDIEIVLARNLLAQSQPERAETHARKVFDRDPSGEGNFDLLTSIYNVLGNDAELTIVTRTMAKAYRERGDEERARELMQRIAADDTFDANDGDLSDRSEDGVDDDDLLGDDFLDDDFLATGDDEADPLFDESDDFLVTDSDDLDHGAESEEANATSATLPVGDPDQLFAEASVYLRYGKRDQAIASLLAILAQEPSHRGSLEKIGECHADGGEPEKAIGYWTQAAELARDAEDGDAFEVLCERIAVLDTDAAATLVATARVTPDPTPEGAGVDDLGDAPEISKIEQGESGEGDFEFDLDFDLSQDPAAEESGAALEVEIGLDSVTDDEAEELLAPSDSSTQQPQSSASQTGGASLALKIAEDLEEAEFYFGQELFDEAEAIYNRVLESAPNHPSALVRLGELRAARADAPEVNDTSQFDVGEVTLKPSDLQFDDSESEATENDEADREDQDDADDESPGEEDEFEIAIDVEFDDDLLSLSDDGAESLADTNAESAANVSVDEVEVDTDEFEFSIDVSEDLVEIEVDEEVAVAVGEEAGEEEENTATARVPEADSHTEVTSSDQTMPLVETSEAEVEIEGEVQSVSDGASSAVGSSDDDATMTVAIDLDVDNEPLTFAEDPEQLGAEETEAEEEAPEISLSSDEVTEDVVVILDDDDDDDDDDEAEAADEIETASVTHAELEDDASEDASEDVVEDDSFDLAAELREAIEEEDASRQQQEGENRDEPTSEEDGFASVFKDFKSGVSKTLADDDYETRFDLGIAYREMELYDDAKGEFLICLASEPRRLESLHMLGLCAMDLGNYSDAANHLEQALAMPDLSKQKEAGLRFDVGRSFEAIGDYSRAKNAFLEAKLADASFPGIEESIDRVSHELSAGEVQETELQSETDESADDDGLESFEDLIAEAEREVESFESFDDLVAEVEGASESGPEVEAEVEQPEPKNEKPPKRRRKRISFV